MFKNFFYKLGDEIQALWCAFETDFVRILLLGALGISLLRPDDATTAMLTWSLGISILLVAASHVLRKILFRRMDLGLLAKAAQEQGNVAAAIVFAAICFVLVALMLIMALPVMLR